MSGQLRRLMAMPTVERRASDYEAVFDDYVAWAGGRRVVELVEPPPGADNADYVFEGDDWRLVIELKQIDKYDAAKSASAYFGDLHAKGMIRTWKDKGPGKITIGPESLTTKQWHRFYDKSWPQIPAALTKANRQVRETAALLPATRKRQLGAAFVVNTGDYNLPTDLLYRFVERKVKKEWKGGAFRSLDFVACQSVDLYHPEQHPLHARHITHDAKDAVARQVASWTFERWVAYANAELGTEATINWGAADQPFDLRLDRTFLGKMAAATGRRSRLVLTTEMFSGQVDAMPDKPVTGGWA